jgi:hypothetical protein
LVKQLQETHLVKTYDCASHRAQVAPLAWLAIDASAKENVTTLLASHCHDVSGGPTYVQVIDSQSGRELAKFDAWGFAVN